MDRITEQLLKSYNFLLTHQGSGELKVNMKILKRGQKEILIHCGRTYRYVIDIEDNQVIDDKLNPIKQQEVQ